ncbi:glycosyltransferase family 2 protein [Actinomadura barringtoniae]|uniref:Glycosyltransferase family 2 protein n=1 Tax=Actinomadura barringtoniae TaxID=1427535 RepID=A0A939PGF3_9ACTN|nr:glycosyltransferase family A protein [Actinomadura barringtoniae]MBO2452190.1 glycosyltransferase family 2 protein [Actinomadura barringtoniae]
MSVKVSVVVPAYNGGIYIDACVRSLLDQTMNAADYEVIFVDDGSTDGTGRKLDEAAVGHEHVRVVHIDNTGGPGAPRNIGLELAQGEYVYFLDCDDWLGPEALERMYAMAVRNGSDIVVGRLVGQGGRGVPRFLFRKSQDRADILKHHLLSLLTPHKLFRTEFVREHGLRFPEGPVRLEDHRFCVPAYFKAEVISVLADYPCCYWVKRADEGNYSSNRFDPAHYYGAVREVLDVVDAHVEPGPTRDRFYLHWLRGKMLGRMGGRAFLSYEPEHRRAMYDVVRELTLDRFDPAVDALLPRNLRPRAALLRAGAFEDLIRLAEVEKGLTVRPNLNTMELRDGTITFDVEGELVYRSGAHVSFRKERIEGADRLLWDPPAMLTTPLPSEALDATGELGKSNLEVFLRHKATGLEVFLPTKVERGEATDEGMIVALSGRASARAETVSQGEALAAGRWDVRVRLSACGWGVDRRIKGAAVDVHEDGRVLLVTPGDEADARKPSMLRQAAKQVPGLRRTVRWARAAKSSA